MPQRAAAAAQYLPAVPAAVADSGHVHPLLPLQARADLLMEKFFSPSSAPSSSYDISSHVFTEALASTSQVTDAAELFTELEQLDAQLESAW